MQLPFLYTKYTNNTRETRECVQHRSATQMRWQTESEEQKIFLLCQSLETAVEKVGRIVEAECMEYRCGSITHELATYGQVWPNGQWLGRSIATSLCRLSIECNIQPYEWFYDYRLLYALADREAAKA